MCVTDSGTRGTGESWNPHDPHYSAALMVAEECWTEKGWKEISEEDRGKRMRRKLRMRKTDMEMEARDTGEQMDREFDVGDIVELKSGGPKMVVTFVFGGERNEIDVSWFDDGEYKTARVPMHTVRAD